MKQVLVPERDLREFLAVAEKIARWADLEDSPGLERDFELSADVLKQALTSPTDPEPHGALTAPETEQ